MSGESQHLDMDALKELKQIMGDEFSLLIETFKNDSVVRIQSIETAIAGGDPEEIRRAAHSFKGSAGNMGATALTELCRTLEDRGHSGKADGCDALLAQIIDEYHIVQAGLAEL